MSLIEGENMNEPNAQIAPNYVTCPCQHCSGHIEFNTTEYAEENSIVPCPHCGLETKLFIPVSDPSKSPEELPSSNAAPIISRFEGFFDGASKIQQKSVSDGDPVAKPPEVTIFQTPASPRLSDSPNTKQRKATEAQLDYIRGLGGNPPPDLTISDASRLIEQLLQAPDVEEKKQAARERRRHDATEREQWPAYYLHQDYEEAKRAIDTAERGEIKDAKMSLKDARDQRLWFWQDTFLSPCNMEGLVTEQSVRLYLQHGHRFKKPSEKRILAILETLDTHSPAWDKDGTLSFYLTLEASFPELIKSKIDHEDLERDKEWLDFKFR
jgi:hypothetical protein